MIQCPACKAYDVHSSKWSSKLERVAAGMMLHMPVRCYTCFRRFYTWQFVEVKPRGIAPGVNVNKDDATIRNLKASA